MIALYILIAIFLFFVFTWEYILAFTGTIFIKSFNNTTSTENDLNFVTLVCAHNEEACIKNILDDLVCQSYKKNTVYVILDNCSDNTKNIVLNYSNVKYIEKNTVASNKGESLNYAYKYLKKNKLFKDAVIILDADCHIEKDFIQKINDEFKAGAKVVMPKTTSLNPYDSLVSSWYTFYWDMVADFSRKPHANLGLSCNITGCGIAILSDILPRSKTITEDVEYYLNFIGNDININYLESASVYQEQPVKFRDLLHQLYRWVCGVRACNKLYFKKNLKSLFKHFSFNKLSGIINSLVCTSLGTYVGFLLILLVVYLFNHSILLFIIIQFIVFFFLTTFTSLFILFKKKYKLNRMLLGALTYFEFVLILGFIYVYAIFFPSKNWTKITRKES